MKRASVFSCIFLIMMLWFLIEVANKSNIARAIDFLPMGVCPLIVWLSFFGYLCFPSFRIFNGLGRKFVIHLAWEELKSLTLFYPITFRVIFNFF